MIVRDADAGHTPLGDKLDQWESKTEYHDYDVDGWRDYRLLAPDLPGTGAGPKRYYMTAQRNKSAWNEDITSTTTFRTTLTFIKSSQLTIDEEVTWGPAADSSTFRWSYDAGWTDGKCTTIKWLVCYGRASSTTATWCTRTRGTARSTAASRKRWHRTSGRTVTG